MWLLRLKQSSPRRRGCLVDLDRQIIFVHYLCKPALPVRRFSITVVRMSIVEVAKLAGVSHATVSRVINRRPDVSTDSIQRVQDAMKELRYVPPAKRRGPKPKDSAGIRTGNIGMLFVGETPTLVTSPVAAFVLHAVQQELAAQGFNLTLGQITSAGGLPPNIAQGQVDGLLMHGQPPSSEIRKQLSRYSACVWLLSQRRQRGYWGDRVSPDNHRIGGVACQYLIDRGHQRVAAINCDPSHLGFTSRAQGFADIAREAAVFFRILADEDRAILIDDKRSKTHEAQFDSLIDQLLSTHGAMPTGLFVPRDALTIRMYRALRKRGIEPGRDVEIVSCDNMPALDGLDPKPATIDVRPKEVGRRAVEQLLWHINNHDAPMNVTTMIEPALMPGDKTDFDTSSESRGSTSP